MYFDNISVFKRFLCMCHETFAKLDISWSLSYRSQLINLKFQISEWKFLIWSFSRNLRDRHFSLLGEEDHIERDLQKRAAKRG